MYIKYIIQSLLNVNYIKEFFTKLFSTLELSAIGFKFSFCKEKKPNCACCWENCSS